MLTNKISIIIPCFNESENIFQLFEHLKSFLPKNEYEFIFVDDFSTDNSFELLQNYFSTLKNVKIIKNRYFKGQAGAYATGINNSQYLHCGFFSADLEISFYEFEKAYQVFLNNKLIFLNTKRLNRKSIGFPFYLSKFANLICNSIFKTKFYDRGSGIKIFQKTLLKDKLIKNYSHRFIPDLIEIDSNNSREIDVPFQMISRRKTHYNILKKMILFNFEIMMTYKQKVSK